MARLSVSDYEAVIEPDVDFFTDWIALADKVGGTVGLTREGGLVITLDNLAEGDTRLADEIAAGISNDDFPHAYVIAGTDSVLIPDLG